jgi:hypothetical protein
MVVEYKPSHKLSALNLRAGLLRADNGAMNIPEEVINRITIPTDPEEKFVYHSERLGLLSNHRISSIRSNLVEFWSNRTHISSIRLVSVELGVIQVQRNCID